MSKTSKFSLLFAGLFAVSVVVTRIILNGWIPFMWGPMIAAFALVAFALFRDWRLMFEFFTLRTTRHGMNMGAMILTVLVLVIAVNFLAVMREKKWDWTSEGLNSLSEQSVQAVQSLKAPTELVLLYRKGENDETLKRQVSDLAQLYTSVSKSISLKSYNALERPDLAQKYEYTSGPYALYLVQSDRHMKVDQPTEEELTRALLRFSREKRKVVYFVQGHGEHDIAITGPDSVSQFKKDLELSYEVKALELFKSPKVPEDAELVVVAGPRQPYLASETEALREYARRGGRLLIALDPDVKHGLSSLTKTFGIEYQNNYVLDPRAMIPGAGNIAALGNTFSKTNEATKPLQSGFSVFLIASSLKPAPDAPKDFMIDEIVKSDDVPLATDELSNNAKVRVQGPHTLGIFSRGRLAGAAKTNGEKSDAEFEVIVFGDSDFFKDSLYRNNLNRDLAMNSVASLAKDTDLVSIRPKAPKGAQLSMTRTQLMIVLFGFLLPLPIGMFFTSGLLWWRRKSA